MTEACHFKWSLEPLFLPVFEIKPMSSLIIGNYIEWETFQRSFPSGNFFHNCHLVGTLFLNIDDNYCIGLLTSLSKDIYQFCHFK